MSDKENSFEVAVTKIAGAISAARGAREGGHFLSPGDVSDLRRMDVTQPAGAFLATDGRLRPRCGARGG